MTLREILKSQQEVEARIEKGENTYSMYIDQSPLTYNEILVSLYLVTLKLKPSTLILQRFISKHL